MVTVNELLMDEEDPLLPAEKLFSKLTLFEKILLKVHLPYKLSTILAALFVGPLGNFLFLFAISFDFPRALYATFISLNAGVSGLPSETSVNWYSFIGNIAWYIFLSHVAFSIRRLRLTLAKLEPKIVSLTLDEGRSLTGMFRLVFHPIPQLAITVIFMFIYGTFVPNMISKGELTLLSTPIFIFPSLLRSIMFGSMLWFCFASLWGLYQFGKTCPGFKSFLEDPMLGAGVLGTMSFSLSKTYFFSLSIFAVQMVLGELVGNTISLNFVIMFVLIPVGIVLFLAPLVSTHKRMIEVKKNELKIIRRQFAYYLTPAPTLNLSDERVVTKLFLLESLEKKAGAISTWPVESPVTEKFVAILTSVSVVILAKYIQIFLHI